MTDLSPEAQLLLLIFASHGGEMTKIQAEAEFTRVRQMTPEDRAAYIVEAKRLTAEYARKKGL
jgi:hypothetical protein